MTVLATTAAQQSPMTCRALRIVTIVPDEHHCRTVLHTLLDRAYRRWRQHGDPEAFPPLRQWRMAGYADFPTAATSPEQLIVAAAAGHRIAERDLAGSMAATLMLHTGCPTTVEPIEVIDRLGATFQDGRPGVLVTVFGLDDDDLTFAGDLLTLLLVNAGAVPLHRGQCWTALPPGGTRDGHAAPRETARYIRPVHLPGCGVAG